MEVTKKQRIDSIFYILVQFEQMFEPETDVTEESYRNYLDRVNVWYLGRGDEEVCYAIEGLKKLGKKAEHDTVRRIVFHIISLINKEEI